MSTSTSMSTLRSSALPILTATMGSMGIVNGLYSLTSPSDAETAFGLPVPRSISDSPTKELPWWQAAQSYARGVRNLAGGLSIVGITALWRFSPLCVASPVARLVAQRCLGVIFLTGSIIGVGDGVVVSRFAEGGGTDQEARQVALKAGWGHLVMAVPILALGIVCFWA
ncbi:hypothetical protein PV04_10828 [Phialophora macrospora]|uniref:Uncharacterized protein n=1 Tax=Phialophora macrospora TaxID=1851006 RepID=A0A0D2F6W1_9EURO|nr:hypothetical protein PV04_10828 [Phialophora macrospora]